ncbi:hypothetical protein K438DRAFT_1682413 [Mycena galopus ATCC 62051]|nr:hypothetical protein K438DRAFT_1682413 [Mycena galopus ATCC 62051]
MNNLQDGSDFMKLPPEIRVEIYAHVFFSTRVALGRDNYRRRRIVPAPHALALLCTCRQVHIEIGNTWLHQVLFSFESLDGMLEKLENIPTLVRYARLSGTTLPMRVLENTRRDDKVYSGDVRLHLLLPGLALDRLTVLASGDSDPLSQYQRLDTLIRYGTGWEELHYLSHESTFLACPFDELSPFASGHFYLRAMQPAGWQRILEERDGAGSGASVTIYRATSQHPCSVLLQPVTRAAYVQTLPTGQHSYAFWKEEYAALKAQGEREKEVLVIVKRGRNGESADKEKQSSLEDDGIRGSQTWKGAKAAMISLWNNPDVFSVPRDDNELRVVDEYKHVDEYVWPANEETDSEEYDEENESDVVEGSDEEEGEGSEDV